MNYQKIIRQSIDLHVHIGPEIIPRRFTLSQLLKYEKGQIRGAGVKNHFFPTAAMSTTTTEKNLFPFVIHSVVLNQYVGGFNPAIVRATADLSNRPVIVWFPTIHAENFVKNQKFKIPLEWVDKKFRDKIKKRPDKKNQGLSVLNDGGTIREEVIRVLQEIKKCQAILATGHISWQESRELIKLAVGKIGLKKIIITHPIYQKIKMPIEIQKELAKLGALIEHSYSMFSIDKIPIKSIAEQIKYVGVKKCILTSDVGQTFSQSPSEALTDFAILLKKEGLTKQEIETMLIDNPNMLIS